MNILSDIWGSYATEGVTHSGADTIDKLCDRVATSTLLEDRRDAVRALRSLAREYQVEVGSGWMVSIVELRLGVVFYLCDISHNLVATP